MIAFVLGGGGLLGAVEVGMLHALVAAEITPDLVVGSSVGAINGAAIASAPTAETVAQLTSMWEALGRQQVFGSSAFGQAATLARSRTHLHSNAGIRKMLDEHAPGMSIEDLQVPFQCVAACIETARAHWFTDGPLADAVLASTAVPGLFPPVKVGDKHYVDGGLVHSIPVGRAVELGATEIYVLQVGRIERPLEPPRWPWEVATVAFEIARRHRYEEEMAALPAGFGIHVRPSGETAAPLANVRYRSTSRVRDRIRTAFDASTRYLDSVRSRD
jgi:NTE family protein